MAKVTRTKVCVIMKWKDESGARVYTVLGKVSDKAMEVIKENNTGTEVGYIPLTYEMEEEDFVAHSKMITDWENTPLFPTEDSCPKSSAELKKFLTENKSKDNK